MSGGSVKTALNEVDRLENTRQSDLALTWDVQGSHHLSTGNTAGTANRDPQCGIPIPEADKTLGGRLTPACCWHIIHKQNFYS